MVKREVLIFFVLPKIHQLASYCSEYTFEKQSTQLSGRCCSSSKVYSSNVSINFRCCCRTPRWNFLEPLGADLVDRRFPHAQPGRRHPPYLLRGGRHPGGARQADRRWRPRARQGRSEDRRAWQACAVPAPQGFLRHPDRAGAGVTIRQAGPLGQGAAACRHRRDCSGACRGLIESIPAKVRSGFASGMLKSRELSISSQRDRYGFGTMRQNKSRSMSCEPVFTGHAPVSGA